MKKYVLGVISDNDLVDKLAQILVLNNWQIMRYTNKDLVFLTKGGQKIVFCKENETNGYFEKYRRIFYSKYNDKGEFLGFVDALADSRSGWSGLSLYTDFREFFYQPVLLNAMFKETSIHAISAEKYYDYSKDYFDNLHLFKNGVGLGELIKFINGGALLSFESLHQALSYYALKAFVECPVIDRIEYPMGVHEYYRAFLRPGLDGSLLSYGDGDFSGIFESILFNDIAKDFSLCSLSFNQNAKAVLNKPLNPFKNSLGQIKSFDFTFGTSFSDDVLSDKMGNDYLYLPQDNYIKGNSFIFIDNEMLIIQFGENVLIIGNGKAMINEGDDFVFTGVRHGDSNTQKYFNSGGVYSYQGNPYHGLFDRYNDLKITSDDNPLKATSLINYNDKGKQATICPNIRLCYKHYNTNKTLKAGNKTLEYIHSSLMTNALLVQIEEEIHG